MDKIKLELIESYSFEDEIFAILGANEKLDKAVIDILIQKDNITLLSNLASNETLSNQDLEILYKRETTSLYYILSANPSLNINLIKELYIDYIEDEKMLISIASNSSTPQNILRELFDKENFEINKSLASNKSTPLEFLDILKIDTRLRNSLTQNRAFIEHHQNSRNII